MAIRKWVREEVEKYSFITRSEMKNGVAYFYYLKDGKEKSKHIPYRANKEQLQKLIEKIKEDIDYDVTKAIRDIQVRKALKEEEKGKDLIFTFA